MARIERIKGHPSSSLLSVPSVLSEVKSISLRLGVSAVKILVAAEIIGIWDLIGLLLLDFFPTLQSFQAAAESSLEVSAWQAVANAVTNARPVGEIW